MYACINLSIFNIQKRNNNKYTCIECFSISALYQLLIKLNSEVKIDEVCIVSIKQRRLKFKGM